MTDAIDLTTEQRNQLSALLRRFLPGVAVWAYGSRVKWTAHRNSDLDLVAFTTPVQHPQVSDLKDALAESNLPFQVDLHVWDDVPERFREIIRKEYVVMQEAKEAEYKTSIPGEWQRYEVSKLLANGKLVVGDGYRAKNSELSRTGLPFARAGNINNGFQFAEADHFPSDALSRVGNKVSHPGDVVFTSKGTVGRFAFVREDTQRFVYSPQLCFWRSLDQALIQSRFLYYWMHGSEFFAQFKGVAGQTDMAEYVSLTDQRRMHLTLPSVSEQRAIAYILGTLDDKIELNRRMNETLEAMARALFKSWFMDFDPVRAKAEGRDPGLPKPLAELFPDSFEGSELGEIPKGWEVGTFGDVAEHPRRNLQPAEIETFMPYIGLEHMPRRCIALSEWGTADGLESNKFEFKKGAILFGKLRPYFHKVGVAPVDGVCSTDIVVITPRVEQWFGFVLGHVSSEAFVEHTNAGSTGTKMPRTSWSDMARYTVVIPPQNVAKAFTSQIRPVVDQIVASIHESRTLVALRDTLLPKLISGALRVKDAERFMERGCESTARNHESYMV